MQSLIAQQGGIGVLPFLAEESTLDPGVGERTQPSHRGTAQIAEWFDRIFPLDPEMRPAVVSTGRPSVFVDTTGMVIFVAPISDDTGGSSPTIEMLDLIEVGPAGITSQRILLDVATWRRRGLDAPAVADEAEVIAARWATAWSCVDAHAPFPLYASDALFEDEIAGVSIRGVQAICDRRTVSAPTVWTVTTRVGRPAIYHADPDRNRRVDRVDELAFVVGGDDGSGCPGQQVVWLEFDEAGLITHERRFRSIDGARRCVEPLPDAWWTGRPVPGPAATRPFEDLATVTGTIDSGESAIEVRNGSATLMALVSWALSRFEQAGMPSPAVDSVAFTRFADYCEVARGRSIPRPQTDASSPGAEVGGWDVMVCIDEGDVCRQRACTSYAVVPKFAVLHEFAHVWMQEHLTDDVRDAFTAMVGLEVWHDRSLPWAEQAVEWAASFIAWGLLDTKYFLIELYTPPIELRVAGFQLLAARQPLQPVED
jgi:hypothetical protein